MDAKRRIKARFDALLDAAGASEQEAATLRAEIDGLLCEVGGDWHFDDLAQVATRDAPQLDALTNPATCPYCGQPMPGK